MDLRGLVALCLDVPTGEPSIRSLGDFELRERLGSGGMGSVWRAWQHSLRREVAVKILHEDLAREPAFIEAFRQEAEITATLRHPGIVTVFGTGEADGAWYYAMEWVDADNLEDVLREHGCLATREAVRIVHAAAEAVGYVHGKGVLHRDIKPSNLLMDATGAVRVMDFGLARLAGLAASGRTAPVLGTPHYVSPEQGKGGVITPSADVYALGAVLYRMLCGRPPFSGETPLQILDAARNELPVSPRRLNPAVPEDVATIILKCLEKEPRRRYPDASALAQDLEAWLTGRPVTARPVGAAGKLVRWIRREPLQAALAMVLTIGATAAVWQAHEATRLKKEATRDRELAALQRISTTLSEGHRTEAKRMMEKSLPQASIASWGFPAQVLRNELKDPPGLTGVTAHTEKIWGLCAVDHGTRIATSSEDGTISIHAADDLRKLSRHSLPHGEVPFSIAEVADNHLLVGTLSGKSMVLDLSDGTWLPSPVGAPASWFTISSTGTIASLEGSPHFWTPGGEIHLTLHGTRLWIAPGKRAAFSPDGRQVAISGRPQGPDHAETFDVIRIFDTMTGKSIASLKTTESIDTARSISWSADGRHIALAAGRQVMLWRVIPDSLPLWTQRQRAGIWDLAFHGDSLFAASSDQSWLALNLSNGLVQRTYRGYTNEVWCLAILPDGVVFTGDKSGFLGRRKITDDEPGAGVPHDIYARPVFSPDGRLFTTHRKTLYETRPGGTPRATGISCDSINGWDGRRQALFGSLNDDELVWVDPSRNKIIHRLPRLKGHGLVDLIPSATGISGDTLYECTPDGIFLRDAGTGAVRKKLEATPPPIADATIRPDGRYLAISSNREKRTARLYDLNTGKVRLLHHASDEVLSFAFSPDGLWLATAGGDALVYVWSLEKESPPAVIQGHLESVHGLAFTSDSRWLVSSCGGESLRFWQTGTWESGPAFPCPEGDGFLTFSLRDEWLAITTKTIKGQSVLLLHGAE